MADKMTNATVKLFLDGREIKNSVADIEKEMKKLRKTQRDLVIGSEEYNRTGKQIQELNGILATHRASIRNTGKEYLTLSQRLGKVADGFNRYMGVVAGAIGAVTGLTMTVRKTVQQYAEMQEAEAQVRKYTGMTADEVERLNEDFKQMDTRTSREQLNALAGDAGRLGITSKEAIEEFVDGADKIKVALGDDLGETAVRDIGKLAQMFGEDKTKGLRGAMLATGSAINELAQNSSAGAGAIVEFTARLAGVAQQAGMTQAQIMGIGSVMDQNMQEIPTSATVISQLITKMMQDTGRFAKLAGKDVEEFSKLLRTDANAALVQFLQAMKAKGGFADMAQMFDEMKMDGTRAIGVLSALAGHLDQLAEAQSLANQAYEEGTSVVNEFNVQNTTVAAELDKAKKRFADLSIELGQKLLPVAKYGITTGSAMVKILYNLINFVGQYRGTVILTTAAIIGYTVAVNASEISTISFYRAIIKVKNAVKELWAMIAANPWAALGMAVSAVVVFLADYLSNVKETITFEKQLNDVRKESQKKVLEQKEKIDLLIQAARNEKLTLEERQTAINQLNGLIPEYNAQLDATTGKYKENKIALDKYLESLQRKYELEGAKDMLAKVGKEIAEETIRYNEAVENYQGAQTFQQNATDNARRSGMPMSQAETMFLVSNTSKAEKAVEESNDRLQRSLRKRQQIIGAFGTDLQREAIQTNETPVTPVTPVGGSGGGGKTGKVNKKGETEEQARQKRIRAEQLKIETEYLKKRNELVKTFTETENMTKEELQGRLERLEEQRLEKELGILGLEESEKEKIMSKIYDIRQKWKEKEVEMLKSMEQEELENAKDSYEKMVEAEKAALEEMEQNMKDRTQLILDTVQQFGTSFGEMMGGFFENGKLEFGEFLKDLIKLALDALEKTMVAAIAERTIKNVATLGWAGVAKAAGEIALITAAFETAKAAIGSFAQGGFTGPGAWNEEKGVVHANEFVANRHATANPSVMPVLSLIDAAQKSGSVANLTSADIASVLPTTSMVTPAGSNRSQQGNRELLGMLAAANKTNQMLLARLKQPLVAETYASGRRGVNEAQDLLERMKSNVRRG